MSVVVLKTHPCELEIAKGVRAKGEVSVTERDIAFKANSNSSSSSSSSSFQGSKTVSIDSVTNQQKSKAKKGTDYFALRISHEGGGRVRGLRHHRENARAQLCLCLSFSEEEEEE